MNACTGYILAASFHYSIHTRTNNDDDDDEDDFNYNCKITSDETIKTTSIINLSLMMYVLNFQLQLWMENPKLQLTFDNALPQIEAPYNSKSV